MCRVKWLISKMTNIIPSRPVRRDGIDRTHVRSMRNRKIPFSGGLVNIAGVTSRLSDEESGHFPQQIPVKPACRYRQVGRFKRFGYTWIGKFWLDVFRAIELKSDPGI